MKGQEILRAMLAILLVAVGAQAQGATVDPWVTGQTYPPITVACGEPVTFSWPEGEFHGVAAVPSGECPAAFTDIVAGGQSALGPKSVTVPTDTAGEFWYACPVGTHCSAGGMLQQVTVGPCDGAPAPSPAITPAVAPAPELEGPEPALGPAPALAPAPDTLPVVEGPSVPISERAPTPAAAPAPGNAAAAAAAVLPGVAMMALGATLLAF